MIALAAHRPAARLPSYALFAGLLAAAGLPIYIHAPKFYADSFGVSLAALGAVLFGLRLLDVVQDPLLGRLAHALRHHRALSAAIATAVLASAMLGLFAVAPPVAPVLWFAVMLTLLFSAYSYLTIVFYAQGVSKAGDLGPGGHLRLARWRETGALLGVCLAAVAPVIAARVWEQPFAVFATGFAAVAAVAVLAMQTEWNPGRATLNSGGFRDVLSDPVARRLLLIALVNAAPVAVSSTLFLFFVESRLQAPGSEGALLLLFFLSAALAAPLWGALADWFGARPVLGAGMVLSILAFGCALFLGAGDVAAFAAICIASGAALGADMTLLPAMFSQRLERIAPAAGVAFGLWSFVSKFTLAFAAITLLPLLDAAGFQPGTDNPPEALTRLTLLYALVPCLLKLGAIGLLATMTFEET